MNNDIETELKRIEERCPFVADVIGDPSFVESSGDVPKLVAALRRACGIIGEMSDAYCGLNDMTGRDGLADIGQILKGQKEHKK